MSIQVQCDFCCVPCTIKLSEEINGRPHTSATVRRTRPDGRDGGYLSEQSFRNLPYSTCHFIDNASIQETSEIVGFFSPCSEQVHETRTKAVYCKPLRANLHRIVSVDMKFLKNKQTVNRSAQKKKESSIFIQ